MSRSKEEKRNRILQAAISVFARKGFFHAKISEIAQEAGVADGTIYLYFKNKDHLLISIFEEKMEMIIGRMRASLVGAGDPVEKLRRFMLTYAELVIEDPELSHVFQVELRQSGTFMKHYKPVKLQEFLNILAEIVREGQQAGRFKPEIAPGVVKRAVFGALDEIALNWILKERRYDLRESARQLGEMFVDGLGIGTPVTA
ncbi:MAG: TetR/AcrR family transcriptional regulator [Candidatus Dadabacteria bacterium]|nr:MAG: TetR/AcrR family transcriptional regulator [Candidatus Dadabacteria bacterium]